MKGRKGGARKDEFSDKTVKTEKKLRKGGKKVNVGNIEKDGVLEERWGLMSGRGQMRMRTLGE